MVANAKPTFLFPLQICFLSVWRNVSLNKKTLMFYFSLKGYISCKICCKWFFWSFEEIKYFYFTLIIIVFYSVLVGVKHKWTLKVETFHLSSSQGGKIAQELRIVEREMNGEQVEYGTWHWKGDEEHFAHLVFSWPL